MSKPRFIVTRDQMRELARELEVRRDWHEPDEQEVTAVVRGGNFDNAGFYGSDDTRQYGDSEELHVIISKAGRPVAIINLATLCAWASER